MKYLKLFNNSTEHNSFKESSEYVTPNICAIKEENKLTFQEQVIVEFYINGTLYKAPDGISWGTWCNSSYNTNGFYISGDKVYSTARSVVYKQSNFNEKIKHTDSIVKNENYKYTVPSHGGGSND